MKKIYILEVIGFFIIFVVGVYLIDINENISIAIGLIGLLGMPIVPIITSLFKKKTINNEKSETTKKNKYGKKIIIPVILIIIVITIIFLYNVNENKSKNNMIIDAQRILVNADAQKILNEIGNEEITCLYVYGYDGIYKNSGNYVGSVDLTGDNPYIELSDGKYFLKGTYDNLTILKSKLSASTNCK